MINLMISTGDDAIWSRLRDSNEVRKQFAGNEGILLSIVTNQTGFAMKKVIHLNDSKKFSFCYEIL